MPADLQELQYHRAQAPHLEVGTPTSAGDDFQLSMFQINLALVKNKHLNHCKTSTANPFHKDPSMKTTQGDLPKALFERCSNNNEPGQRPAVRP